MNRKTQLLAGAAIGLAIATAAPAEAAPKHRRAESSSAAQIRALNEKVEALEARLAASEQAQRETAAKAQQAQASAQAAADEARAAQTAAADQIKTIPAQVKTEVAANRPKPGWEAKTSISGRMYYNISNINLKRDGTHISPSGTGFDFKRFYVGVDHKFNDTFSANVTTDVQYNSAEGLTQVYVKKAYLQTKFSDLAVLRLGSADLPWVPFAEGAYGYRYIENTVADRTKFGTSADWGAHLSGKSGIFSYQVSVINGSGYKKPVRSGAVDVEGRVSVAYQGFTAGIGGYSGKLGKKSKGGGSTPHTAQRFDALLAYAQPRFRVGVEYFAAEDWNNVNTTATDKADGVSLFGNFNFTPKIAVFGRWDHVNPSKTINSRLDDNYFNIGLNYAPVKIVDFALVYKRDRVEHGQLSTSNGTIGSPVIATGKGIYDEVGVFGRLRW